MKKEVDRDEMIFDYLEGNLSPDQVQEMELWIKKDPDLKLEVETWKKTYLTDLLPDNLGIEDKLIRRSPKPYYYLFLNSFLYLGLMFLIFPKYLNEEVNNSKPIKKELHTYADPLNNETITENDSYEPKNVPKRAIRRNTTLSLDDIEVHMLQQSKSRKKENDLSNEWRSIKPLPVIIAKSALKGVSPSLDREVIGIRASTIKKHKLLTKKELRKRNNLIRKAYTNRKANEFRKGRVPYVVPLENINF